MANIIKPLLSTEASIYNDIYYKVMDDVARILGLDEKTSLILHNSMGVGMSDMRSNAKSFIGEDNTPTTTSKQKLIVTVEDDFEEETVGVSRVNSFDNHPIFYDPEIEVSITPIYTNNTMQFEFRYISPSKVDVDQIRNHIRMVLSKGIQTYPHDIEYSMIVPEFTEGFIQDVHELKNRLFPIPIRNYVELFTTNRLHMLTDMSNRENIRFAIREKVLKVHGEFEFVSKPPRRDSDNTKNQHTLSFGYSINMDVPVALNMNFPVMICNEIMKDKYIDELEKSAAKEYMEKTTKHPYISRSLTSIHNTLAATVGERLYDIMYPIHVPSFDSYLNNRPIPGFATIMTILCEVDESDRKTLFNLTEDLDGWTIPHKVREYIRNHLDRVTHPYGGFIYLGLDQKDKHNSNHILKIDEDLNIVSTEELELLSPVRVTIQMCINFTYLSEQTVNDLTSDGELLEMFLMEYFSSIDQFPKDLPSVKSRDANLTRLLVDVIYSYSRAFRFEEIRRLIKVVNTNTTATRELGTMLANGFSELFSNLVRKGVCVVDGKGNIRVLDNEDEKRREKQLLENEEYNKHLLELSEDVDFRYRRSFINRSRSSIKRMIQMTATTIATNTYKENKDGNS